MGSRKSSEQQSYTSKLYNRSLAYPAVIEVNTDIDKSQTGGRPDRSHLYHPTVSSIVDAEEMTMQQLAPQVHHHEKNVGVLKVSTFYQV